MIISYKSAYQLDEKYQNKSKHQLKGGQEQNFTTKEMISMFPLWTFHSYVATFQQHLHMEYISLSWYDILELVVPIRISW
jgi:hypothetical protein